MRLRLALVALLGLAVTSGLAVTRATASEAVTDTNIQKVTLAVNTKGEALLTYVRATGTVRHVLAYGAINAIAPGDPAVPQIRFKYDYAGGWGKYRNA